VTSAVQCPAANTLCLPDVGCTARNTSLSQVGSRWFDGRWTRTREDEEFPALSPRVVYSDHTASPSHDDVVAAQDLLSQQLLVNLSGAIPSPPAATAQAASTESAAGIIDAAGTVTLPSPSSPPAQTVSDRQALPGEVKPHVEFTPMIAAARYDISSLCGLCSNSYHSDASYWSAQMSSLVS